MPFSPKMISSLKVGAIFCIATLSGCGILGSKEDPLSEISFGEAQSGCLNEFGPKFIAFYEGKITSESWAKVWDCTDASFATFKTYVKGSHSEGYTQDDIHLFVNRVLKTDKKVSRNLIAAAFELKTSLIGGTVQVFTRKEIDRFNDMLKIGKRETTSLIPLIQAVRGRPAYSDLLALTDGLQRLGREFGTGLPKTAHVFTLETLKTLITELGTTFGWEISPRVAAPLLAAKSILVAGSPVALEGEAWPRLFQVAGIFGGAFTALLASKEDNVVHPEEFGAFLDQLSVRVKKALDQSIDWNGGRLTLGKVDLFVDSLADDWLTVGKSAIKNTLRPVSHKLLLSQDPESMDQSTVDAAFSLLKTWARAQFVIEQIFLKYRLSKHAVSTEEFAVAALDYRRTLEESDKRELDRVLEIAQKFRPLFYGDDNQANYSQPLLNSFRNLSLFQVVNLGIKHLIRNYAVNPRQQRVSLDEFKKFYKDFEEIGIALKVIDPNIPRLDEKRFAESDLFTFASNGDGFMDINEGTYYVGMLISVSTLKDRVRAIAEQTCRINDEQDFFGWFWMDPGCFKKEYFSRFEIFWDHFSGLSALMQSMSSERRESLALAMERTARTTSDLSEPIGNLDAQNFAGVVHFMEAVLTRFDRDRNERLNLSEVMTAFPTFRDLLIKNSKGQIKPGEIAKAEALFTYILKFRKIPDSNIFGVIHFLSWMVSRPFWNLDVSREDLYQISGLFNPASGSSYYPRAQD